MRCFFIMVSLTASILLNAQDCSKEVLQKKPGIWKAGPAGSVNNIEAANLVNEKKIVAAVHKMISSNYKPTGCQISYNSVFGKHPSEGQTWIADPYHYSMYILRFLCDNKSVDKTKYYVDVSTPTTVNVTANVIYTLNNLYAATIPADDFRGYFKLLRYPQRKDGAWFMGEEVVGDYGRPGEIKEYRWLITYNDSLPFSYVSRKEYLLIQKKRLEKTMKEEGPGKQSDQYMNNIDNELKQKDEILNKPAICPWNDEQRFTGFVTEGKPGSFIAVKPNLNYYRKNLPKSAVQFFTVVYKISSGDEVFEENITAIKKAIDFETLKNMLGK